MNKQMILILSGMIISLASCSRITATQPPPLVYKDVSSQTRYTIANFPSASFSDVIWRPDGKIIALQDLTLREPYAVEGDDILRYLDLEKDSKCSVATIYWYPTQLPDGRLGLIKRCSTDNMFTDVSYMVAYDWRTGELKQIVQKPLLNYATSRGFSWNPEMTRGIQVDTSGIAANLVWLTPVGPEPVNIIVQDGNRSWDLSRGYETTGDFDEDLRISMEGGLIVSPIWSPSGDKIAVFMSFDAMGMEGIIRLDQQFQLIFLYPDTGNWESALSGIYYPESPDWSPDGRNIAFVSHFTEDKEEGLWVFDAVSKSLILIAKGGEFSFKDLSWSPDSKFLAVLWCDGIDCDRSEIRKYSIPTIK